MRSRERGLIVEREIEREREIVREGEAESVRGIPDAYLAHFSLAHPHISSLEYR